MNPAGRDHRDLDRRPAARSLASAPWRALAIGPTPGPTAPARPGDQRDLPGGAGDLHPAATVSSRVADREPISVPRRTSQHAR